jgi:hypothetical protein
MTRVHVVLALALATAASACAGGQRPEDTVNEAVRVYNEDLRWGRYESAALRLASKHRSDRVDEWDAHSKDLKITDFEIVRIDPRGPEAARAQVKVSWYLESEQILRETSAVEQWERKGRNWMLVDEQRLRGHEMPGLPEPMAHVRETHGSPPPGESR